MSEAAPNIAALPGDAPKWAMAFWATIFVGLPLLVASPVTSFRTELSTGARLSHASTSRPSQPPPPVEPLEILKIAPVEARSINAAIPFSTAPNPAAHPFIFPGDANARAMATDCLAAAQLYEAGDDMMGQEAVAQVVINRMRHPAFPKTVCGVVFQGSDRRTGCQFTFTCDGALARTMSAAAWERARALAGQMLSGKVDNRVGYATHYHTNWVVPYWSSSLDKITLVGTHLFFRWKGWWGTPAAFRGITNGAEPAIDRLSSLSPPHARAQAGTAAMPLPTLTGPMSMPEFSDLSRPATIIGRDRIGDRFGPARLAAINSTGDAFVMLLDRGGRPDAFEQLARQMCGGRTKCRLLGWTRASDAPNAFPIDEATLATMSYAYLRSTNEGMERSLYNCREFIGQPKNRCMRERMVMVQAQQPVQPARTGTETIRLTP